MNKTEKHLLDVLKTIKGSGAFATSGVGKFTLPGLHIEGVGEIGFPLNPIQIREIVKHAEKAPFGKGSQTITDTAVRSAWEVDAERLSFHNEEWEKFLGKTVKKVKKGLGIEKQTVKASLYKLLIYEEGDFFLPHQDSEKEKGMFATLVIGLPSAHAGGELVVRFDGREEIIGFSPAASNFKMPFAAFYADCEHEIKPVTSGYRVCLVYNLLQSGRAKKLGGPTFGEQAGQMAELLQSMTDSIENKPKAILLDHQYTPANFSLEHLKRHDRPRAEALMEAAGKAGYFATLGLVTHYQMGELEGVDYDYGYHRRRYRGYYEDPDPEEGTMGEIYEESTTIEHWSDEELPGLGRIHISPEEILADLELGGGDPVEQAAEGYTGNAGMTMAYWYHYGAVVLWPQSRHMDLLQNTPVSVRLNWLKYYRQHWEDVGQQTQAPARRLIAEITEEEVPEKGYRSTDFSPLASVLAKMQDEAFLKKEAAWLLAAVFNQITVDDWTALIQAYNPDVFPPILRKATATDDIQVIDHLLKVLQALDSPNTPALKERLLPHIRQIPDYLRAVKLHKVKEPSFFFAGDKETRKEAITAIVENVLALSKHREEDGDWVDKVLERLTNPLSRKYVNEVLVPILLSGKYTNRVPVKKLHEVCVRDLSARAEVKPSPPSDWKRQAPRLKQYEDIWQLLHPFLSSPTQRVFEYRANERHRKAMASAINSVDIDLEMETIRKGSPYTLKLTKTMASHNRAFQHWKEDVALLEKLKESG